MIHMLNLQNVKPYYRNEQKIMVVNTPLPCTIAVGTTKTSVVKFWVGIGVLENATKVLSREFFHRSKLAKVPLKLNQLQSKTFMAKTSKRLTFWREPHNFSLAIIQSWLPDFRRLKISASRNCKS